MLTTKQKLSIARLLKLPFALICRALGNSSKLTVRRQHITWELDLNEGIDLHILVFGCFEPSTSSALSKLVKSGDVVFDVGANIGAHTLPMARLVGPTGRVYAFEPTDFAYEKACRNLSLNSDIKQRVVFEQAFLTDSKSATVPESIYSSWPLDSEAVHPQLCAAAKSTSGAEAFSLDEYVETNNICRLDLIKLDVDGYECSVLRGARDTLMRFKPTIVLEIAPYLFEEYGGSLSELLSLLSVSGYELRSESNPSAHPITEGQIKSLPFGSGINVLAVQPNRSAINNAQFVNARTPHV